MKRLFILFSVLCGVLVLPVNGQEPEQKVYVITLDQRINSVTADYVKDAIDLAYQDNAQAVIIDVQSIQGFSKAINAISGHIQQASLPIILYSKKEGLDFPLVWDEQSALTIPFNHTLRDFSALLTHLHARSIKMPHRNFMLDTQNAQVLGVEMDMGQKILNALTDETTVYLLFILGLWAIIYEIAYPGLIFPGATGIVFVGLSVVGLQNLPINALGLSLIGGAIVFFILEALWNLKHIANILGMGIMAFGSWMLFSEPAQALPLSTVIILSVVTGMVITFLMKVIVQTQQKPDLKSLVEEYKDKPID